MDTSLHHNNWMRRNNVFKDLTAYWNISIQNAFVRILTFNIYACDGFDSLNFGTYFEFLKYKIQQHAFHASCWSTKWQQQQPYCNYRQLFRPNIIHMAHDLIKCVTSLGVTVNLLSRKRWTLTVPLSYLFKRCRWMLTSVIRSKIMISICRNMIIISL